uniref:Uncharacterized protein n=1 Tax=Acrobeloides nanus TaxID=290746 RepID=A0A914DVI6_9BILA
MTEFDLIEDEQNDRNKKEDVLYEDQYCKLTKTKLVVKKYFFPTMREKTIYLNEIKTLFYKEQEGLKDILDVRCWGLNANMSFWALDWKRIIGATSTKSNILLDVDCYFKKGFSVTDVDGFLKQFRKIAGSDVRICHGFEF